MGYFPLCLLSTQRNQTEPDKMNNAPTNSAELLKFKLIDLIDDVLAHDGYSDIHIEVKILKRGQKEVILHFGKQYRFVIDMPDTNSSNDTVGSN
jgi:hypothetical protein